MYCKLCFKDAREVGIISEGLSLIYWKGEYHIASGNGHYIIYTFPHKPISDPDPECELEEPETEKYFIEKVFRPLEAKCFPFYQAVEIYEELNDKTNDNLLYFLANRCGELVEEDQA